MSYPLIILGAGASYDSGLIEQYKDKPSVYDQLVANRPPLTNSLFNRGRFERFIDKYDEIIELATHAVRKVGPNNSLEEYLTNLSTTVAQRNPKRYKELFALRFYLADVFSDISKKFHRRGNNYAALLKEIEDWCDGRAIFVSFNYDTLLEQNIRRIDSSTSISDYISDDLSVIKIHGSCNWVHQPTRQNIFPQLERTITSYIYFVQNAEQYLNQPMPLNGQILKELPQNLTLRESDYSVLHYLPALTIPVAGEHKEHHVCPVEHVDFLKTALTQLVDKILIIGWRANDPYLVNLINSATFTKNIPLYIVTNSRASAAEVATKFTNKMLEHTACESSGFSHFLNSSESDNFFQL